MDCQRLVVWPMSVDKTKREAHSPLLPHTVVRVPATATRHTRTLRTPQPSACKTLEPLGFSSLQGSSKCAAAWGVERPARAPALGASRACQPEMRVGEEPSAARDARPHVHALKRERKEGRAKKEEHLLRRAHPIFDSSSCPHRRALPAPATRAPAAAAAGRRR